MSSPAAPLPLPTLLSWALVAFTIELDNEFEHQTPHRTAARPAPRDARDAPWLTSLAMWANYLQFVDEAGTAGREIQRRARISPEGLHTATAGMERWGYVIVAPDPTDPRPRPPRPDWRVRPTAKGRMAQETWRPLPVAIEARWRARFGEGRVDALRHSLTALAERLDGGLPAYLPLLRYGLFSMIPPQDGLVRASTAGTDAALFTLLSQVLLAFTLDFESDSAVSLATGANVLRVLDDDGVRVRDLPRLCGVSKESISMALGFLQARGHVVVEPDPAAARTKQARLTPKGVAAKAAWRRRLAMVEDQWRARFGAAAIDALRQALEPLAIAADAGPSPLFAGLQPYPEGWRASVPRPQVLPHHPMVLHRGGYPDGA